MKVWIVAKTRYRGSVCVHGLTEENQNIRLLQPDGSYPTAHTKFDIGQTWALTFYPLSRQSPPHIEDVIVTQWKQLDPEPNLREILLERVTPWQGGPNQLFGGYLRSIMNTDNTFISERDAFPYVSMGYWLPDASLIKWHDDNNRLCYRYYGSAGELKIDYTGFAKPVFKVVEQTLVHVALHP